MGCCRSAPEIEIIYIDSSLTHVETTQLEMLLSEIPDHCQQIIINLPARELLNFYQYHKMALNHGLKREWPIAIFYEHRAIRGLQALLPMNKDHYIFFNFYVILSASFLALGELEAAIEWIRIALAILLKHTPMDHRTISAHYYHLANIFKVLQDWKTTEEYLIKAIEAGRLMTDLDQKYIGMLETELQIAKQGIAKNMLHNFTLFKVKRKQNASDCDPHRRRTAEIITSNTKHDTVHFNEDEFECLPGKQTEFQVTDEILQDV